MTAACFGRKPLPPGPLASVGDKTACIVDKTAQFAAELEAPGTDSEERLFALKFLLHFMGDVHQPLHASDNNDAGGNSIKVMGRASRTKPRTSCKVFGTRSSSRRSPGRRRHWRQNFWRRSRRIKSPSGRKVPSTIGLWKPLTSASATFMAILRLSKDTLQRLDSAYVAQAEKDVALQLSKAGVRLAAVLNKALGRQVADELR